ncbi:MAG: hypothetical protein ACLGPL_08955 [Acidobacteriota bacterium]
MNHTAYATQKMESYRGHEFTPGGAIEPLNPVEGQAIPQTQAVIEATVNNGETLDRNREEWLEGWMKDIKAFIRNIDVSKL